MIKLIKLSTRVSFVFFFVCSQMAFSQFDERIGKLIQGVNYVGVSVSDIQRTAASYSHAADLNQVFETQISGNALLDEIAGHEVSAQSVLMRSSNAQLRLMQFDSVTNSAGHRVAVEGPGIAHICFQVAKTTNTYQRFLDTGATPIGEPEMVQLNPRNPVDYAYAADVDGIISEIEHIDFEKVSRPRKHDYRIRHVSLATPNMERMVAFYSVLMEKPDPRRSGIGGTLAGENFDKVSGHPGTRLEMAWFQVRNLELEIIQYHSHPTVLPEQPRPLAALGYNMIMFDVVDIIAAREKLMEMGAEVLTPTKLMDGGDTFFARDPDGNLLGFQELTSSEPSSSMNFEDNGV